VQTLTDELKKNKQPTIAIFSALQDKDIKSMIDIVPMLARINLAYKDYLLGLGVQRHCQYRKIFLRPLHNLAFGNRYKCNRYKSTFLYMV
jgi:hypothetical protein